MEILNQAKIHFDILWLDACFMANLEFLYEIKKFSSYTIASEEAEFTAGLPFQYLNSLTQFSDVKAAAIDMASNFIESYSYLKAGVQRSYVKTSSATTTVFDNTKFANLVEPLKAISQHLKSMSRQEYDELIHTLQRKFIMEDKSMVDLGHLLIELRKINRLPSMDSMLTRAIRMLGIESVRSLKQTIKLKLTAPSSNALLVYGFNEWSIDRAPENFMKVDGLTQGPLERKWPYILMEHNSKTLYPFFPGIYSFNYYFKSTDGKLLTQVQSITRTDDVVEEKNTASDSPIIYTAYTQQIGTRAERYSGVNISMPNEIPSLDYFELEFNQLAQWLSL